MFLRVTDIPLPGVAFDVFSTAGTYKGPVSMLVMGMVLRRVDLRRCFLEPKNCLFSALRLVILPLVALAILLALGVRSESLLF